MNPDQDESELNLQYVDDKGDEAQTIQIDESKRNIITNPSDPEIISLFDKWKRGRLILQPDFQRRFVWDKIKCSRLIESALLQVPLPVFYFAEGQDGRELVIDGQQRLVAFFSFIDGKFPNNETFKLSGLNVYTELNRKGYADLDEYLQEKIRYYNIRTITILKQSDPDLKFEIFERLNTGSVPLNDMELRNCVYRGPYIELLKNLAEYPDFRYLLNLNGPHKRMTDVGLVLRFASFYHLTYLKYKQSMKQFFNRDMEQYQNITEDEADDLSTAFKNSVTIIKSLFDKNAFKRFHGGDSHNPNGEWEEKRFNSSLFDVWMGIFCNKDKTKVYASLDSLRESLIDLMATNEEFIDAILIGTSSPKKVQKRFDLARNVIDDVLSSCESQPRCFSYKIKQELFDRDPTCAICGQHINGIDDAAVDHVEQYWRGGKTIPENARLAHRYCNMSRPKND